MNGLRIERSAGNAIHLVRTTAPILVANSTIRNNRCDLEIQFKEKKERKKLIIRNFFLFYLTMQIDDSFK